MVDTILNIFNFTKLSKALDDVVSGSLNTPHRALHNPDVLLLIFSFCLPSDIACAKGASPLNFSQVCRTWRYVTFSRGSLWSKIVIDPQENASEDVEFQRILERCKIWVRRAGGAPLRLDCKFDRGSKSARKFYAPTKIHDILEQLFFDANSSNDQVPLSPTSQSMWAFALPSQIVELKLGPMFYVGATEMVDLHLSKASNLQKLEIARPVVLESSHWKFPNLRILSLKTRGKTTLSAIIALMESSENLEEVKIAADIDTFNEDFPDDVNSKRERSTRLRNLRTLELIVTGTWSGVIAYLVDRLEATALRALTVSYFVDHPSVWRSISEFIKSSRMDLKILHLACLNPFYIAIPRDTDILRVLEQSPTLEFLYLHGICLTSLLTRAMSCSTRQPGNTILCPQLRTLCLAHGTIDRTDFVGLGEVLWSRSKGPHSVSQLARVFMGFEDPRFTSVVRYLNKKAGQDVVIPVKEQKTIIQEKERAWFEIR